MALTVDRLKEVLDYNPEMGDFVWKKPSSNRISIGDIAGNRYGSHGYISIGIDGKLYLAHRLAWFWMTGEWPKKYIDHINFVKVDNRWINLREADDLENSRHRRIRSDSKSGIRGVQLHKETGKWRARIRINGKTVSLGLYSDKISAGSAYAAAARLYFGEFDGVAR